MPVRTLTRKTEVGGPTGLRVLVVEDNDMIMRMVGLMLDGEPGFEMRGCDKDVASLLHEEVWRVVDVALVDLRMPGVSGDELLRWLAEFAPHVRRIAMSGGGALRLAEAEHAHAYLLKPFMLEDLLAALRG
jgi:DNA-binding NtrC family response regulator